MLSLRGIKSFVFAWQASARRKFSARLTMRKQSFLFSWDSTWPPCDKGLLALDTIHYWILKFTASHLVSLMQWRYIGGLLDIFVGKKKTVPREMQFVKFWNISMWAIPSFASCLSPHHRLLPPCSPNLHSCTWSSESTAMCVNCIWQTALLFIYNKLMQLSICVHVYNLLQ